MASMPKAREKGVRLVERRGVVRYAQSTLGSSSTHLPRRDSSRRLSPVEIALLVASA